MKLQEIIKQVDQFIPFEYKKNFYKNIQNLTIEYIGTKNLNYIYNEDYNEDIGEYNWETNTIIINLDVINNTVANAKNKNEAYEELLTHTLIHELLHMASTSYKKNKPIWNGFGDIKTTTYDKTIEHIGLTEGYTELLTSAINQKDTIFLKNHPFAYQILFAKQIEILIGKKNMYEAYFNDSGIKLIYRKLKNIDEKLPMREILKLITDILEKQKEGQSVYDEVIYIQNELLELLHKRVLNNELSIKKINEFKQYVINSELLESEKCNNAYTLSIHKKI